MLQINKCKSTLRLLQFWDSIYSNSFFSQSIQDIQLLHYCDTSSRNFNHSADHRSSFRLGNGYLDWEGKNKWNDCDLLNNFNSAIQYFFPLVKKVKNFKKKKPKRKKTS